MNAMELLRLAFDSIRANRLRSILTLLGMAVGVISIIAVMTALGVLQQSVESGLTQLGTNTFQIQRSDAGINSNNRETRKRRPITWQQAVAVKERVTLPKYLGIEAWDFGHGMKSDYEQVKPGIQVAGGDYAFFPNNNYEIADGRPITEDDVSFVRFVAVLGKELANNLFPSVDPVGQQIYYRGMRLTVVGVMAERGQSFGQSMDNLLVMPITTLFQLTGQNHGDIHLTVMAQSSDLMEATIDEVYAVLRAIRQVEPGDDNDFSIFSNDSLIEQFNNFTMTFKMAAAGISLIALLAAGVGIMNIMLVSVTERTREIGIRKAIGATRSSILIQFISEAIIICQVGGFIGIIIGTILGNSVAFLMDISIYVSVEWAFIGLFICTLIGVLFGTYPALKAAGLDPVESLRYE